MTLFKLSSRTYLVLLKNQQIPEHFFLEYFKNKNAMTRWMMGKNMAAKIGSGKKYLCGNFLIANMIVRIIV